MSRGSQAPVHQLGQVGGEEQQVNSEQDGGAGGDKPQRLVPVLTHHVEEQQSRDRDRAGDRHAERIGESG